MSTNMQDSRSRLLNNNTVARTILGEYKDLRMEPEDLRTRRFGYNPGFLMQQDPRLSGLQTTLIEPGVLILFETSPVSRQNPSVDPEDQGPPNVMVELLAGEGFHAVNVLYDYMGWRELKSLRGLEDERALDLFYLVHPPLSEFVEHGVIPKCPYEMEVCITCRRAALETIKPTTSVASLLSILKESVAVGRTYMAQEWRRWVGEVASTSTNTGQNRVGIREFGEGHLYFMRQLHERTPSDQELLKVAMQNETQVAMMREMMSGMAEKMAEVVGQQRQAPTENPEFQQMKLQMEEMQRQIAMLSGQPQVGEEFQENRYPDTGSSETGSDSEADPKEV